VGRQRHRPHRPRVPRPGRTHAAALEGVRQIFGGASRRIHQDPPDTTPSPALPRPAARSSGSGPLRRLGESTGPGREYTAVILSR
jgi:hypothetical protein